MTLNVGLSKKIGQPDYGSLGASCGVTVELDAALLRDDLDAFHNQVRKAYTACRQAVQDELARHQSGEPTDAVSISTRASSIGANGSNGNGRAAGTNGNAAHGASQKQVDYINQLARQIRGLGIRRVESLAQRMFGKPLAGLSSLDASGLIDTLKAVKVGEVDINDVLEDAAR
jgi:hypothetical protein